MKRHMFRVFLVFLLGSLGIAAVMGIVMVMMPEHRKVQDRLIWTALVAAAGSLMCFLGSIPVDRKRGAIWGWGGILAVVPAGLVCVMTIWCWGWMSDRLITGWALEYWRAEELIFKVVVTACVPAVYLVLAGLLVLPRMKVAGRCVQIGTVVLMSMAVVVGLTVMWTEPRAYEVFELFFAIFIFALLGMIATPILGRFYGVKTDEEMEEVTRTITMVCPRCGVRQEMGMGEGRCCRCRVRMKVEVEESRCPTCGYRLHGLTRAVCPECGNGFDQTWLGTVRAEG